MLNLLIAQFTTNRSDDTGTFADGIANVPDVVLARPRRKERTFARHEADYGVSRVVSGAPVLGMV
ncbi:hypothetical protein [Sinorhizobium sp. BG8]|uniref:hypothetical protein n=1 Tax=Sinorhizobium sp. BG8 TaxID=2613773 RepID=UPI00193D6CB6|nr:hypothetical protein [Sinorhizobium sp. BG8]QRM55581.1 hypothetical protein F3Y30_14405 [Sinorhizobium sp. BG8]